MMTDSISQTRVTRAVDSDRQTAVTRSLTHQGLAHRLKAKTRQTVKALQVQVRQRDIR